MVVIKPKRDFTNLNRVSYTSNNASNRPQKEGKAATSINEYKENLCASMGIGIGPRIHDVCPFSITSDEYAATGSTALESTIYAAYRQVLGNLRPTESQRLNELESQLMNGNISVRDFVAGIAKSEIYKQNYFYKVSAIRGVELNLKHLLGRTPINQNEVSNYIQHIAQQGFDSLVEKITSSGEYLEVYGIDTVPYLRSWNSEAGAYCSTFLNLGRVTPGYAGSDTTIEGRSQLVVELSNARRISSTSGYDVSGFKYSSAVKDPTSAAFKRMFQPKTAKSWT